MTSPDDIEQPKQSVQSAWVLRLRREAERMQCDDMSRILYVGLLLATYTDAEGGGAWPSPDTLAGITGYSVDMVRRCLAALVGIGLLARRRRQSTTSMYQLLLPATAAPLDWAPRLVPFEQAREAAARRRAKAAAKAGMPVATGTENPRRDGAPQSRTPVASGNSEHPSRRGTQDPEHPSRHPQNTRRVGESRTPVASGGYLDQSSTSGRDPDNDQDPAWVVAQPQVPAREAEQDDHPPPDLTAIVGGGRGTAGGQSPLLLTVQGDPAEPAVPDHRQLAEHLTELYGVHVPVRQAAVVALHILGDQRPADPTAHVLDAVRADPDTYRAAALPPAPRAPRRASGGT